MSTKVPTDTRAKTAKQLRKLRGRRLLLRMLLGVGLPTLIAAIYQGGVVTPRYESVTSFTVQSANGSIGGNALMMLVSNVPGTATRDVLVAVEYMQSRDMLRHLIADHGYREHYTSENADYFSRLPADADSEETYEYFLDHIEVEHDSMSDVLTLRVQAFDAESAHRFGLALLQATEARVNALNEVARQDRIDLAQSEVERAEARLAAARTALTEVQAEHGDVNPLVTLEETQTVRASLESALAIARADLSAAQATLPRNAPEVIAGRRRVGALSDQIDALSARLAGSQEEGIGAELAEFEPIVIEKEFAQRAYESALASLEVARVDAARRHRYVVQIAGPSQPERPRYPRFWYTILTVLVLSFALLGVGTLLVASIREHANV